MKTISSISFLSYTPERKTMKKTVLIALGMVVPFLLGFYVNDTMNDKKEEQPIRLGAFSMSMAVKDLKKSKEFYEKLGFRDLGGSMENNYLIMKNENAIVGLFQGMFEGHMLTFNPGWDEDAKNLEDFDDVREIQKHLKAEGVSLDMEADEATTGPASIMLKDPDGNIILIDQHR